MRFVLESGPGTRDSGLATDVCDRSADALAPISAATALRSNSGGSSESRVPSPESRSFTTPINHSEYRTR